VTDGPARSVLDHPEWETRIKPLLRLEYYGREGRVRIEAKPTTLDDCLFLESLTTTCARCGAEIAPFRSRRLPTDREIGRGPKAGNHLYFAASCVIAGERIGCSRSKASSMEYARVANAVRAYWVRS